VNPVPFAVGGTFPQEWIETLDMLNAMEVETIVPGHGDVERDKTYLQQNLKLFRHVLADVRDAKARGITLARTKEMLGRNAKTYAADLSLADSSLAAFKSYFLDVFVNRAYHELEGPLGDSPTS